MLFSQRKGYKPLGKTLQTDSMDEELRNGLWSSFHFCYLEQHERALATSQDPIWGSSSFNTGITSSSTQLTILP